MPALIHDHTRGRGIGSAELRSDDSAALMAVLESVDCGVVLFGIAGELWAVNDRFAKMWRVTPAGLRELVNFEMFVEQMAQQSREPEAVAALWRKRVEAGAESLDELELVGLEPRILERRTRPVVGGAGERLGWTEIYRDITSQRSIDANRFHSDRMAALGVLVSGIAHELNNPLTSILGYAQLMLQRRRQPERDADAQRILGEVERASRIARNLLLFARQGGVERTRVNLNDIVERALTLRRHDLRQAKITMQVGLEPSLPLTVADAGQLQQVLLNLLLNAEQAIYMRGRRPGTRRNRRGRIWVGTRRISMQRVLLEVIDDGPGIAPEIAARIFDPFFTTKPPGVGTGLGLSIVFSIVQEHGGHVSVRNLPRGGAAFRVELPVAASLVTIGRGAGSVTAKHSQSTAPKPRCGSRDETVCDALPSRDNRGTTLGSPERILVVEDEPTVARLIADVLAQEGYLVDTVLDSRKGLARVCSQTYDLTICDLRMPHLDGRGLYHKLAKQRHPLHQRIVFVTGNALTPQTLEFLRESGGAYLAKPFRVEELKDAVRQALGNARRRGAHSRQAPWTVS